MVKEYIQAHKDEINKAREKYAKKKDEINKKAREKYAKKKVEYMESYPQLFPK